MFAMNSKLKTSGYVSNQVKSVRMFKASWMEALSKIHFSVPLFIYIPVIVWFLLQVQGNGWGILGLFISGLFVWTLTEYILHRFIFHWVPPGKWGERLHFIWHGVHHDYPNDQLRLVLPPSVSVPLSILFYGLFRLLLGTPSVYPFFSGFMLGYLCYDMMHYAMHHLRWNNPRWLKIKNHHMLHHYQEHDKGFGVSNPLWDYVFNTTFKLKKK
jgi:sterol desaturase/sphingolipid hydroxylase (fatty acid hydroxylase superfamily)